MHCEVSNPGTARIAAGGLFIFFVLVGFLLGGHPLFALVAAAIAGLAWAARLLLPVLRSQMWQILVLVALSGYILLNYGFANLAFRVGGVPLIIGHGLMFAALALAAVGGSIHMGKALREPTAWLLLALTLLTLLHLVSDIPRYGFYAVRDASIFLESIFVLLGLAWGRQRGGLKVLMQWLLFLFSLNFAYCLMHPWQEPMRSASPTSGIFLKVPLLGFHAHNALYLLAGALFCLFLGGYLIRGARWVLWLLAAGQLFALAVLQARSMYIGIVVVLFMVAIMREVRKLARLAATLALGIAALVVVTSILAVEFPGRVGPVTASFLEEHANSLLFAPEAPGAGTIVTRLDWYQHVWEQTTSTPSAFLVGSGFGEPLIEFTGPEGTAVRQPHNSHLTVLARLGAVGALLWILCHISIMRSFLRGLGKRAAISKESSDLLLWLFIFYVLSMIFTSVQPHLEFSYGAIPFYFFTGLALGITRRELSGK